jgi:hypothetical protein
MMPPTRLEQLGNFQDSIQSPEGLERLRALQYIQSALPSSQGLMGMPQVSTPVVARQYGGEVGTGGLVGTTDDGVQIFDNSQEGILNRSLHGGILQGQQQTSTATGENIIGTPDGTGYTLPGFPSPDSPSEPYIPPSGLVVQTGQDKYGNVVGDMTGTKDYYDLNFAAQDAGQDTFMYGDKLMQVDPGYLRGGGINPFISNRLPAGLQQEITDSPHLFTKESFVHGLPNLNTIQKKQGDPTDPSFYKEAPYLPTEDFTRDISGKYNSYYEANQAAKEAGSPTFMWGDKLAKTDPGLLPDYVGDPKPFISNAIPEKYLSAGVYLPPGWSNMPASEIAKQQPGYVGDLTYYERIMRGLPGKTGGQISSLKGGGQISDTAEGLASLGRYGDNMLVHMNPEELQGLASLGEITYNPVTGLPEAFSLKGIFKGIRKLAPVIAMVAAPYVLGPSGLGIFSKGFLASTAGAATAGGLGSFVGSLIAGAKPKDALKQGLTSAVLSGGAAALGGAPLTGGAQTGTGQMAAMSPGSTALKAGQGVSKVGASGYGVTPGAGGPLPTQFTSPTYGIASSAPKISRPLVQGYGQTIGAGISQQPTVRGIPGPELEVIQDPNIVDSAQLSFQQQAPTYGSVKPAQIMPAEQAGGFQNIGQSPLIKDTGKALSDIGSQIADEYGNVKGITRLVGMDLMQPDWDAKYANEAREKEQALQDAGYTVDTGFDGQTVIRDSQGVIMPRNLTPSMILDRALGKSPRQRMVARYGYGQAKHGGLVSLAHGGEFSGMVPGDGHGMEDNVYMPIKEGSEQVGTLAVSPSEYVVDSYTMAALGNGNADEGAKIMDGVVESVRKKAYGTIKQPNEISGLEALKPMMERV